VYGVFLYVCVVRVVVCGVCEVYVYVLCVFCVCGMCIMSVWCVCSCNVCLWCM